MNPALHQMFSQRGSADQHPGADLRHTPANPTDPDEAAPSQPQSPRSRSPS